MSERTAPSLAKLDVFLDHLSSLPKDAGTERMLEETQALRRATAAFHMEAIRFRVHNVERALRASGNDATAIDLFDAVRHALEEAGFHTRSHAAP